LERERDDKLINVEAIMAAIAHEVRQPLMAIVINGKRSSPISCKGASRYLEATANLNRMINDCRRASEVFDSILTLFRPEDQERQAIDVNEIALEVLQSTRGELVEHHVTTRTELASELPPISGHRRQLQQVISNLVQNAIEAMDYTTDRDRVLWVRTGLYNRDAIIVAVEDSGPGVDPKQLGSLFDAFFTTKSHGIGLGLAICRMIVERHGGKLTATSEGNNGARFHFCSADQVFRCGARKLTD
jgi:signal transduction histidine kinase